jgi:hypothetical protein
MKLFACATTYDGSMHAKIQNINRCRYLQINIIVFEFL